ncbi:MAG: LPS export ABC transporter periplasmic protein LptC [Pseudomonadota bacterium]
MAERAMAQTEQQSRRSPPRARRHPVRDYSRFVTVMKFLLPTLAAGLIVLLAIWSQIRIEDGRFRIGVADVPPTQIDRLSMISPRFEGIDDRNRPFTVTAEEASQVKDDEDLIDLVRPQADMTLENGTWIALSAEHGRFQRSTRQLQLVGQVSLFQDQGYELHAESVAIDFSAGSAVSDTPVHGQGPSGDLAGEGLKLTEKGQIIELTGKSRVTLYADRATEAAP